MAKTMKALLIAVPAAALLGGFGIAAAAGQGDPGTSPARNEVQVVVRNQGAQQQMQQIQVRHESRPAQPTASGTNQSVQSRDRNGTCDGTCDGVPDRLQTQDRVHSATCTPTGTPTGTGHQHHRG